MKPWYEKPINKNSLIVKQIQNTLKKYYIKRRFYWSKSNIGCDGYAMVEDNTIVVYGKILINLSKKPEFNLEIRTPTIQQFISTVCHEMGHILSYREGRYPYYNRGLRVDQLNQKEFSLWASEMLLAERLADKIGKELTIKEFNIPYISNYSGNRGKLITEAVISGLAKSAGLKIKKGS